MIDPPSKKDRQIAVMAADLKKFDSWRNEADACWTLYNRARYEGRYSTFEAMAYVDLAMESARCDVIAEAMGDQ